MGIEHSFSYHKTLKVLAFTVPKYLLSLCPWSHSLGFIHYLVHAYLSLPQYLREQHHGLQFDNSLFEVIMFICTTGVFLERKDVDYLLTCTYSVS